MCLLDVIEFCNDKRTINSIAFQQPCVVNMCSRLCYVCVYTACTERRANTRAYSNCAVNDEHGWWSQQNVEYDALSWWCAVVRTGGCWLNNTHWQMRGLRWTHNFSFKWYQCAHTALLWGYLKDLDESHRLQRKAELKRLSRILCLYPLTNSGTSTHKNVVYWIRRGGFTFCVLTF